MTGSVEIYEGDCRAGLLALPAGYLHTVVTSIPYFGLRAYGTAPQTWADGWVGELGSEPTPDAFVAHIVEVFRAVWHALRPDGTVWLNIGDSYTSTSTYNAARSMHTAGDWKQAGPGPNVGRVEGIGEKNLLLMPARVALALQADGWTVRSEIIWCLGAMTRVYARTQKGEMPMTIHDLIRLDPRTVQLWNGTRWTQVLGWSETANVERPIRLTLRSGERLTCTAGHEWPTQRGLVRADSLQVGDVLQTCILPEPETPAGPGIDPDLAWFAGLYLAEGSMSDDAIQIAGHERETARYARLAEIAARYGGSCVLHRSGEHGLNAVLHGAFLRAALAHFITGHDAHDKHLHPRTWRASNLTLRALLDGYLAGDGAPDSNNLRWRLGFCNNPAWAADLRTLAARLGLTLTLNPGYVKQGRTRTFDAYRGELRFTRSGHHNERDRAEIVAIGTSTPARFYDIGVADEPHLFALASGILTHNSKPNPMPESVTDRPTKAHEQIYLLTKGPRYFYDADAIRETAIHEGRLVKASGAGAKNGQGGTDANDRATAAGFTKHDTLVAGRNARTIWTVASEPYPAAHFATFPTELPRRCILAGTSARGCCSACGAPWRRVVAVERTNYQAANYALTAANGAISGGVGKVFPDTARQTTGWEPTCRCAQWRCLSCDVVVEWSHGYNNGTTHPTSVQAMRNGVHTGEAQSGLLQPPMLYRESTDLSGSGLQEVREDVSAPQPSGTFLQQGMCESEYRAESGELTRMVQNDTRLHPGVSPRSSTDEQEGVHHAASASHGGNDRPTPTAERSGTSQERAKGRQPARKSRVNGEKGSRQHLESTGRVGSGMPALSARVPHKGQCPHCNAPLTPIPYPVEPCRVGDPFLGSGTTAAVAVSLGRAAWGCELQPAYIPLIRARVAAATPWYAPQAPADGDVSDLPLFAAGAA